MRVELSVLDNGSNPKAAACPCYPDDPASATHADGTARRGLVEYYGEVDFGSGLYLLVRHEEDSGGTHIAGNARARVESDGQFYIIPLF